MKGFKSFYLRMSLVLFALAAIPILISSGLLGSLKAGDTSLETFNFSMHGKVIFEDSFRGTNPNSNITFALFSDFACPACIEEYPAIKQLMENHTDVNFIFKHLVLPSEPESQFAARAYECSRLQSRQYDMANYLFTDRFDSQSIYGFAENISMDMKGFADCLNSSIVDALLDADIAHARDLSVTGTPTVFLNGIRITGVHSYEVYDALIKQEEEETRNGK